MREITVYSKNFCGYCTAAKELLRQRGYDFREINLEGNPAGMQDVMQRSGQRTLPQIFVGDTPIGGYRELSALMSNGGFETLVANG